ncbi:MAG: bifunctional phosphoribosylaminoimidazolecarboxamide formyltransferase/inosine monophosphate cyclohydrolase [Euryarchaeota archaeon]|nr:bifunctional phosphoribosylaminoimidazolecarboxamide formyltransferase/inosine monophosphate cyclohydrolase [Euryarchaeota archaeon]
MSSLIKRALISVSDKSGLEDFGKFLHSQGIEILSTGGSASLLRDSGIPVIEVSDFTGFPEIMDGRVKTLQPKIHGGILAVRDNSDHEAAMKLHAIEPIDLVVVNLYPFEATVAKGADFTTCIENIDIGGPALIRAGAKNHAFVTVVVDPTDYDDVTKEMKNNGGSTTKKFRSLLAAKAYARTCSYDAAISSRFSFEQGEKFPSRVVFGAELKQVLRYGENPHQEAALYTNNDSGPGVVTAKQLQGKELSYNNLNDVDAAFELVAEFRESPACVIVKHANPCGVALANDLKTAYMRALSCDTESAFGGVIAFNRKLDEATAKVVGDLFVEVIIAPEIDEAAQFILNRKKNLRVLVSGGMPQAERKSMVLRSVSSGYLLQGCDHGVFSEMKVVTKRGPSEREWEDLKFAFTVSKHVKSNAIVYCKEGMTVGIGAGQMSRVNSSRIAAWKAEDAARAAGEKKSWTKGSVVASDAFFPFSDGLVAAAEAGITAAIQPGGSIRDEEVILAADEKNLAMVFTGMRHFRH